MSSAITFNLAPLEPANGAATHAVRWVSVVRPVTGKGRWVRQTSCLDAYASVEIRLEPYDGPDQFQLVWQVSEQQIPEAFLPGVVDGIREAARQERPGSGVLRGLRVT